MFFYPKLLILCPIFSDIVFDNAVECSNEQVDFTSKSQFLQHTQEIHVDENITSMEIFDVTELLDPIDDKPKQAKKKRPAENRKMFSAEEANEIKTLFSKFLAKNLRPTPKAIRNAMETSKKNNGMLWKRSVSSVKNRLFRMIR